jgi:hypothetical protein
LSCWPTFTAPGAGPAYSKCQVVEADERQFDRRAILWPRSLLGFPCGNRRRKTGFRSRHRQGCRTNPANVKLWFANRDHALKFFGNFEIQENGCQLWMGPFFDWGHGLYTFAGEHVRVHRLRWICRRGVDLPDDIFLRHVICHNPACPLCQDE